MSAQDVAYPRDRGQVRMMRQAGMSVRDCAEWFGVTEAAVERTLEELRAERGPEYFRELMPPDLPAGAEQWKQQQADAVALAHTLYRLLGSLCQHPAHGRGSVIEAARHRQNDAGQREVAICYYGWEEELVALGVATPDMLGRKVKGRKRIDADGDRFNVSWYWRLDDNRQPQLYYKLTRIKPVEVIDSLPLARGAVVEYLRLVEQGRARAQAAIDEGRGNADFRVYTRKTVESLAKEHRELARALMPPALREMVSRLRVPTDWGVPAVPGECCSSGT